MAIRYEDTIAETELWTKHFTLMSDNDINPVVPGFYRVNDFGTHHSNKTTEKNNLVNPTSTEGCPQQTAKDIEEQSVPITISTPSDQVIEVVQAERCNRSTQRHVSHNTIKPKRKKVLAVEQSGGTKKKGRQSSVKYCKEPKGVKRFHPW